ncbi:MMPL family transporter [Streptomyces sp. NPDC018693]|uniref:MMPL family transporter n=1 Tax=unclassified Streptomyces TaxID=2593676 RepID=UPI00379A7EB4
MATIARWCLRHRLVVLLLWVAMLFGTGAAAAAGDKYSNAFDLPGTESGRATERMAEAFPELGGDVNAVVWHVDQGSVRDADVQSRMTAVLDDIAKLPDVGNVAGPYGEQGAARISEDGRTAYAEVTFTKQAFDLEAKNTEKVIDRAEEARTDGLQVELGGQAIEYAQQPPEGLAELVAIVAAAVVLFLAFGSLFAMLLPVLTGIFAVGTSVSLLALLSHGVTMPDAAPILGSLVGLGVGIDYALFVVTRHRKGLKAGLTPAEAAERALDTSGRAVFFAGGTVCVALLAMFALGMRFLNGIAIATSLTVVLSVAAALTLLPAMLGLLGMKVLSRRERRRLAAEGPQQTVPASSWSVRWAAFVERSPRVVAAAALAVMVVLALPALSLRLGGNDQGNHPESQTTRQAYDLLADGFGPGFNGPLLMVVDVPGGADGRAAVDALADEVRGVDGVARVSLLPTPQDVPTSVIQVVPTTSPQDEKTDRLIDRLRDDVVPAAERESGISVDIGGATAIQKDFAEEIGDRLPLFVALIVALGAVLLMIAFRSVVVPLLSAVMNLIAAAASFGLIVAFFQWGWGIDLLGMGKEGPIISYMPAFMLPLLFGLSMDYQVFLVSRMHEEWVYTKDNTRAVAAGLVDTSRVINSAALIMIAVFGSFVLSPDRAAVMTGIALAGAVALDAFILRMMLVPALMLLLGKHNWWLPSALDRVLPKVALEAPSAGRAGGVPPQSDQAPEPAGRP